MFIEYESKTRETVAADFGALSFIVGKFKLSIQIVGGRDTLEYDALLLDAHILSVSCAATNMNFRSCFEVDYLGYSGHRGFLIDPTSERIVFRTVSKCGIYVIDLHKAVAAASAKKI